MFYDFEIRLTGRFHAPSAERAMELVRELATQIAAGTDAGDSMVDAVTAVGALPSDDQDPD